MPLSWPTRGAPNPTKSIAEPFEHGGRGQRGEHGEHGLPPTVSSQEIAGGSRLPRTPKAARLNTIVGADPRLPASAMKPQSRNEKMMPTVPTARACQNEIPNRARMSRN
jgi:hypothetical protein